MLDTQEVRGSSPLSPTFKCNARNTLRRAKPGYKSCLPVRLQFGLQFRPLTAPFFPALLLSQLGVTALQTLWNRRSTILLVLQVPCAPLTRLPHYGARNRLKIRVRSIFQ